MEKNDGILSIKMQMSGDRYFDAYVVSCNGLWTKVYDTNTYSTVGELFHNVRYLTGISDKYKYYYSDVPITRTTLLSTCTFPLNPVLLTEPSAPPNISGRLQFSIKVQPYVEHPPSTLLEKWFTGPKWVPRAPSVVEKPSPVGSKLAVMFTMQDTRSRYCTLHSNLPTIDSVVICLMCVWKLPGEQSSYSVIITESGNRVVPDRPYKLIPFTPETVTEISLTGPWGTLEFDVKVFQVQPVQKQKTCVVRAMEFIFGPSAPVLAPVPDSDPDSVPDSAPDSAPAPALHTVIKSKQH